MNNLIKNFPFLLLLSLVIPLKIGFLRTTDLTILLAIPLYLKSPNIKNAIIKNFLILILLLCLIQPFFIIFNNDINIISSIIYSIRYLSFPCLIFAITKSWAKYNTFEFNKIIKNIENLINFFIILNIIFFGYQIITGKFYGDYGLVTFGCFGATALCGIQIISLLFINVIVGGFKQKQKIKSVNYQSIFNLSFLRSIILIILGIGIGSRSFLAVLIFFITLKFFTFITKYSLIYLKTRQPEIKIKKKYINNSFICLLLLTPFTLYLYQFIVNRGINLNRLLASLSFFEANENLKMARYEIISAELEHVPNIFNFFIGNGFSYMESLGGNNLLRIGMHSQYSRLILEVGLIGLAIFIIPLLVIIKREFYFSISSLLIGKNANFDFYINLAVVNICFLIYFFSYDLLTISTGIIGLGFTLSLGFSLNKIILKE